MKRWPKNCLKSTDNTEKRNGSRHCNRAMTTFYLGLEKQ